MRAQIFKVINWAKLAFFGPQTWPINNFNLAQLITLKNVFFRFQKCAENPFFSAFWISTKICPKNGPPKKTITFDILQNTGS